jgi:hypothetical protein
MMHRAARKPTPVLFGSMAVLCFLATAHAQAVRPGLTLRVEPKQATVGDPIRLDLEVSAPAGSRITVLNPGNQIGDLSVLEFYPGPVLPGNPARQPRSGTPDEIRHSARIVVAAYKTGEFEIPALSVSVQTPDGKELTLQTQPVKTRIDSILAKDDQEPKGLKKQADIQEPVRWIYWAALGCLLLLLSAVAVWLWGRRRRPGLVLPERPPLDPLDAAEAELRDLAGRDLYRKGLFKQHYVALSEIVRGALHPGFGMPTLEKTTSEIMDGLRICAPAMESGKLDRIESLLLDCDLVKFAKYLPSDSENEASLRRAFEVIEICRKNRAPAAGPAPVVESV